MDRATAAATTAFAAAVPPVVVLFDSMEKGAIGLAIAVLHGTRQHSKASWRW